MPESLNRINQWDSKKKIPTPKASRSLGLRSRKCIIDAGYISYIYGIYPSFENWHRIRVLPPYSRSLIFLDRRSERKDFYQPYKIRRKQQRKDDERKQRMHERVQHFREFLLFDTMVPTLQYPGLEADDLVSLWFILHKPPLVIGIDKDYHQIPRIKLFSAQMIPRELTRDTVKYPKYAWEKVIEPKSNILLSKEAKEIEFRRNILWYQAAKGDTSDSIPRLLSSKGGIAKKSTELAFDSREPFRWGYSKWGQDFIRNLKLVLFPWYRTRSDYQLIDADDYLLLDIMDAGNYWHPVYWAHSPVVKELEKQFKDWQGRDETGGLDIW